jgi:hypothetical protein
MCIHALGSLKTAVVLLSRMVLSDINVVNSISPVSLNLNLKAFSELLNDWKISSEEPKVCLTHTEIVAFVVLPLPLLFVK